MPQMLGHWSGPAIGCRTATATRPRGGFFMPAVCESFNTNFCAGIHSAAVKKWFVPGYAIMAQRRGLDVQVFCEVSAVTGNTWAAPRAPCTEQNVPWPVARGPSCFCHDARPVSCDRPAPYPAIVPPSGPRLGPVGPVRRLRLPRRGSRAVGRAPRTAARGVTAASRCMFFTNSSVEKRYGVLRGTRKAKCST